MALSDPYPVKDAAPPHRASHDPVQLLTDTVLRHGDVSGILPEVLARVAAAFAADTAVLLLSDPDARTLTVAASLGVYADALPAGKRVPGPREPSVVPDREPVRLEEIVGLEAGVAGAVRASLGAAIFVDSVLLGSLHLGWLRERHVRHEFRRLREFADRLGLAVDHARLYRAERSARSEAARAERRFRDLVHNLDAIVWEAEVADWRYTFVSRRAEKMLGYAISEWLSTPDFWLSIVHPEDRAEVDRQRRHMLERGRGKAMEYRVHAADGRTLWMRALCEVVRDFAGVPRQMRGLMLDITKRRRAEQDALRLAAIVESSDDAIIGKDLNGIIRTWNAGAEKMYGYTAAEAVGNHIGLLTPAHLRPQLDDIMRKLRAGEGISHLATQRLRKDGEIIEVALTVSPIRDPKTGAVVGGSTIARDITAMKRAERTLRNTEKLAATGRLAASIAHEINNPMASVTNLLYLLQHHEKLDATAAEFVRLAQDELQRITHIVRQMLGFYREAESPVAVDLKDIIENVLLLYQRRLQNARIQVDRNFRAPAIVRGFPGEIRQVFSNVVVNAIEAMGENGRLRFDVRRSRDWSNPQVEGVRVLIADTGPGITPEARRHIFEPFFTTKGERGTGLGLWVSEGIVRKHGGSMRVRSASGAERHGTCFSLFFPLDAAAPGVRKAS